MLRNLFGGSGAADKADPARSATARSRVPRHSSGWGQMLKHFREHQNLRVLDVGPTSPNNINYLTSLGHSIYMADLIEEAAKPRWKLPAVEGEPQSYDASGFVAENMDFAGRTFDAVLFWDTADYLPEPLITPVIERLHQVMSSSAVLLGFFHVASRESGREQVPYCRYHLTDKDVVEMQEGKNYPVLRVYNNRGIEKLFAAYSSYRFLLAKDNMREVIVTR